MIENDEEFENEKHWMDDALAMFITLEIGAKDYLDQLVAKSVKTLEESAWSVDVSDVSGGQTANSSEASGASIISQEGAGPSNAMQSVNNADNVQTTNTASTASTSNGMIGMQETENSSNAAQEQTVLCSFKVEKPKLPKFSGDVRDYATFKSDWKHIVENQYSKRDAIALLRTNLTEKPLELIRGIGNDYDAAWEYLGSIYGDLRFVSDTVSNDINKFKALQDGEDARFCELLHLVRRSYNTLKAVGAASDMDNSHMLAVIERKMCPDDRKVWSRDLEKEGNRATLQGLVSWMTTEMKSRMRTTAAI